MFTRTKPKSLKTIERERVAEQTFMDYLEVNEINPRQYRVTTPGIRKVADLYGCNPNTVRSQLKYFFGLLRREADEKASMFGIGHMR